jgi:hypothetical protein
VPTAPLVKKDANVKHSSELVICATEHKLKKEERVSPKTDKKQRKGQQVPKMKISRNFNLSQAFSNASQTQNTGTIEEFPRFLNTCMLINLIT